MLQYTDTIESKRLQIHKILNASHLLYHLFLIDIKYFFHLTSIKLRVLLQFMLFFRGFSTLWTVIVAVFFVSLLVSIREYSPLSHSSDIKLLHRGKNCGANKRSNKSRFAFLSLRLWGQMKSEKTVNSFCRRCWKPRSFLAYLEYLQYIGMVQLLFSSFQFLRC
jgi:hypothetical protein